MLHNDHMDDRALSEVHLDGVSRELLAELRADDRVQCIDVRLERLGFSDQTVARARATLMTGEICEARMLTPVDALLALALHHRLRKPGGPRLPRSRMAS